MLRHTKTPNEYSFGVSRYKLPFVVGNSSPSIVMYIVNRDVYVET